MNKILTEQERSELDLRIKQISWLLAAIAVPLILGLLFKFIGE